MLPKLTVSGYRGIWGDTLNPTIARKYFEGFAQFLKVRHSSKIIIARDTRSSGKELSKIATDVFTSIGIDVVDIGITPTPTVLYLV
jgi:phosphomannomutase